MKDADWAQKLKGPWQELAANAVTATPFQTWEWQSSWWAHFAGQKRPFVITIHDGGDLVGLMPFYSKVAAWRVLRPVGMGHSDYLHPLSQTGRETEVSEMILNFLSETGGFDLLDWHQLREGTVELPATDYKVEQATCLVLDLPTTYEDYLKTLGKSLRYDARRIDKVNGAKLVPIDATNVGIGLELFFDLHQARWKKRGLPGAFMGTRVKKFHAEWAAKAIESGMWRMTLLELDGNPVGAIYAMATGKTCFFYQAGFDPAAKAVSPGTLLVAHTIRDAIEGGYESFDFLRGDEPYKRRWMPQHEYRNYRLLIGQGFRGKLGLEWNRRGSQVEARVRARFEGKGLL